MNRNGQGRKPKPTALKVIDGRTKATRIEPDFPEVELNQEPPMPLQGSALAEWQRVINELVTIHFVTQADLGFCVCIALPMVGHRTPMKPCCESMTPSVCHSWG